MPAPPFGRETTAQELPAWYSSFRFDLNASIREAFAIADADANRRALRHEELLTELLTTLRADGREGPRPPRTWPGMCVEGAACVSLQHLLPESGKTEQAETSAGHSPEQPFPTGKVQDKAAARAPARVGDAWQGDTSCATTKSETSVVKEKSSVATGLSKKRLPSPLEGFLESSVFSGLCTCVILLNSAYMGMIADYEIRYALDNLGSDAPGARPAFTVYCEIGFLAFYTLEVLLKIVGYGRGFFIGASWQWNLFDLILIIVGAISFVDLGYNFAWLRIFRALVKLLKALRVFRLVRFFRELRVIMLSIMHSIQTFFWAMATTMLLMYMCAIVFVQGAAEYLTNTPAHEVPEEVLQDVADDWGSLHKAILTEYKAIAGGGPWGNLTHSLWDIGPFYYFFFLVYIAILVLAVFKLLTGIFVQKAKTAADNDRDRSIEQNMLKIFAGLDQDNSGSISRHEFKQCIESDAAIQYFKMLHIKPSDARNLFSLMDSSGDGHVDTLEFISGCQKFGGWARSIEVAIALRGIHESYLILIEFMMYVEECFDAHFGHRGIRPPPHETMTERLDRIRNDETRRMLYEFDI